jgi:hypothetical protein
VYSVAHKEIDLASPNRSEALCDALRRTHAVRCEASGVTWLDTPAGVLSATFGSARVLVRGEPLERTPSEDGSASSDDATLDLFLVRTRLSPEGQLLDVSEAHNLTHSSGADESSPVVLGETVAYLVEVDGHPEAVHVLDLRGHAPEAYDELSRFERAQVRIADRQATGQARGIQKTIFAFTPPVSRASLELRQDAKGQALLVTHERGTPTAATETTTIDLEAPHLAEGSALRVTTEVLAKPPTFAPWMSDRLRGVSWFGDERNQALKAIVFTALDWLKGRRAAMTGDDGAQAAKDDLGSLRTLSNASYTDPELGWPPAPLDPVFKPSISGEGQWIRLDDDPFITPTQGLPSPFVTTFVRTDPSAIHTRVYVTMWDPRLIALHMEAGTVEPVSATGEAGPGQIPRAPAVLRRVVGGFNGGFQATHGEFGMQANGVLYLPPKPYAATVLELRDGTTAFGAWPNHPAVPDDIVSFRQNMTFMVQGDKYNPWGRLWWGGVPPGWHDAVHTTRSGLCLTKEGFVAYLFGHDIGPEPLGRAMLAARCQLGMHLDMNPGLAGFEFYNVQPAADFKPLGRPLQTDWEHEGTIRDAPDLKFRARRMVRGMGHILFPRYLRRDARDFFYLTARHVLPGAPLDPSQPWRVRGLPQHGYPYAMATTTLHIEDAAKTSSLIHALRIDPRVVAVAAAASEPGDASSTAPTVVAFGLPPDRTQRPTARTRVQESGASLYLTGGAFSLSETPPSGARTIAPVVAASSAEATSAHGAVGISDDDGMLTWLELSEDVAPSMANSTAMLDLLARAGCSSRALVASDIRPYLGGTLDIAAQPTALPSTFAAVLRRSKAPGARAIFESTPIVPQPVWQPLQSQRVKWRPTKAPPSPPAAASTGPGNPSPSGGAAVDGGS